MHDKGEHHQRCCPSHAFTLRNHSDCLDSSLLGVALKVLTELDVRIFLQAPLVLGEERKAGLIIQLLFTLGAVMFQSFAGSLLRACFKNPKSG
jgi:hypothetical protein